MRDEYLPQNMIIGPKNGLYRAQKPENPENPGFNNYYYYFKVFYGDFRVK